MTFLIAASVLLALLAAFFLGKTIRCTRRGRLLRAGASIAACATTAVLATAMIMLLLSYYGYERLTDEQKVSSIEFRKTGPDEYRARLLVEGLEERSFLLRGDEWQIDARLVVWKPPATLLGLDPIYRLERLSGRFTDIGRERSESRTVHSLFEPNRIDVWQVARRFPLLTPGIDAYHGSATYLPMADGARYDISLTRNALIARPANAPAKSALGRWE